MAKVILGIETSCDETTACVIHLKGIYGPLAHLQHPLDFIPHSFV